MGGNGAAPSAPAEAPDERSPEGLVDQVGSGLMALAQGAPPAIGRKLEALAQAFAGVVDELKSGPSKASGAAPVEAGANEDVQPAY